MNAARQTTTPDQRAFGCLALAVLLTVGVVALVFFVIFIDSGADTGEVRLELAESYGRGTVQFVGEHNFYLVRLGDGSFIALADLDAANRAAAGRQCRVSPIASNDPGLPGIVEKYAPRLRGQAQGTTLFFRENCNSAIYNVLGERMDAEGPNLDRYRTSIDSQGYVVVDISRRRCSRGPVDSPDSEIQCP